MSERPYITGVGTIVKIHDPGRLYEVEMKNGHRAYAVIPRGGVRFTGTGGQVGEKAVVEYSPYDMTRCKIVEWVEG